MDPGLIAQTHEVSLSDRCARYVAWRTLAVLELCRGPEITDHSIDHDELEEHILADLSDDACRIEAGNLCIAAITAGLADGLDAVDETLKGIARVCPYQLPFASAGPGYEDIAPMEAVAERLKVTVEYLSASGD